VDAGDLTNTASVTGTTPDGNTTVPHEGNVTTPNTQTPAIALIKKGTFSDTNGNGYADVGETIGYEFNVTNTGNVSLHDVVINDSRIQIANLSVGDLNISDSKIVDVNYTITQQDIVDGNITNQATANAKDPSGNSVSDTSDDPDDPTNRDPDRDGDPDDPTVMLLRAPSSIAIVKQAQIDGDTNGDGIKGNVGDVIEYTFIVTNTGKRPLHDLIIDDARIHTLLRLNGTLDPGQTQTATARYVLTRSDLEKQIISNQARVRAKDPTNQIVTDRSDNTSILKNNPTTTKLISKISGTVWIERNNNSTYDGDDELRPGIIVELLDENGNPVSDIHGQHEVKTDKSGQYHFDVIPGKYHVRFRADSATQDDGWLFPDENTIYLVDTAVDAGEVVVNLDAQLTCGCEGVESDLIGIMTLAWSWILMILSVMASGSIMVGRTPPQ
jgi:hypothetical protein